MAKKVKAVIKLQLPGGKATPGQSVGSALGPHGIPTMDFLKQFNVPIFIVLTKADKLGHNDFVKQLNYFKKVFPDTLLTPFSAVSKLGVVMVESTLFDN